MKYDWREYEHVLPCWKCGGKAFIIKETARFDYEKVRATITGKIRCMDCGLETPSDCLTTIKNGYIIDHDENRKNMIARWNSHWNTLTLPMEDAE